LYYGLLFLPFSCHLVCSSYGSYCRAVEARVRYVTEGNFCRIVRGSTRTEMVRVQPPAPTVPLGYHLLSSEGEYSVVVSGVPERMTCANIV
jgi:hypothetical protein